MKSRPVLILAIILTITVEISLMILVYNKIGGERFPTQIVRLIVQIVLILWVLNNKSNIGLFLLAAYHILIGLFGMYSRGSAELLVQVLIGFHLIIGLVIYFHDWIEDRIGIKKAD